MKQAPHRTSMPEVDLSGRNSALDQQTLVPARIKISKIAHATVRSATFTRNDALVSNLLAERRSFNSFAFSFSRPNTKVTSHRDDIKFNSMFKDERLPGDLLSPGDLFSPIRLVEDTAARSCEPPRRVAAQVPTHLHKFRSLAQQKSLDLCASRYA